MPRLDSRASSIDRIGCTAHVAGAIGTQPDYHLGDLLWLAKPAQGRPAVIWSARSLWVSAVIGDLMISASGDLRLW
jgi:hypothetical protein